MSNRPIRIDVKLTESAIAEDFLAALAKRYLPERFFYWLPLSVRAWLALCQDGPYRNYVRSDELMRTSAASIGRALRVGSVEIISLGAGQGTKDLHLVRVLAVGGRAATYVPVDASQALLELACQQARREGVDSYGIKADLTDPSHLQALASAPEATQRVYLLIGNTLGGFDPPGLIRQVRGLVKDGDLLVVDGELYNDAGTRSGYDNPLNRAFALAPLKSVGVQESDGELVFEPLPDLAPGLHRLGKYFRPHRDLRVTVGGEVFTFRDGERVDMNHSGKYERTAFLEVVTGGGFDIVEVFESEDHRFLMVAARPRPVAGGG